MIPAEEQKQKFSLSEHKNKIKILIVREILSVSVRMDVYQTSYSDYHYSK